ncbi:MAG: cupin domain-containing protein [Nitrospirales bacterium]|nr:cupin domain-containing protein [Nitrospirales bacterium]
MEGSILRPDKAKEYYSDEGCFIWEFSNSPLDEEASITRARVRPGETTAFHRLTDTVERYLIMEGKGIVEIGDLPPTEVLAGDVVIIPAGTRQRISNTADSDLVFLCIQVLLPARRGICRSAAASRRQLPMAAPLAAMIRLSKVQQRVAAVSI